ncbi:MAG: methionine adenosyltransferase [Coriobacteriia bacterium]|nr:methionine adenosyltransferase [Coriobacteriia bacterium]MCL2750027.1 methionine adenosyltransferase [Coriobacteriia bacterium]
MNQGNDYIFTSESVTEGHPDKVCDQISDSVLDAILKQEGELEASGAGSAAEARVACETMATEGQVFLAGELRTSAYADIDTIVRSVVKDIGYDDVDAGFHYRSIGISNSIHSQSADIARGVDESYERQNKLAGDDPLLQLGAGDQGMMFGFASNQSSTLMPIPIYLAHRLSEQLTLVRKNGDLDFLRPDGKTQVSVRYKNGKPVGVDTILISTQHAATREVDSVFRDEIIKEVIAPVMELHEQSWKDAKVYINPTGRFVAGGPAADTGLTGRKIIVDTYGGYARHGGGAFSGKDSTKVDRSAAYAARWVAKNIVAAGLAEQVEIQLAYGIGIARPLSIMVECFGTNTEEQTRIANAVNEVFDLRPGAIIRDLELLRPIFRLTSNYGHFGRELPEFTWEKTDRVKELQAQF